MDQEHLAAGDAAIPGHQAQGLREFNDLVTEAAAAAGTTEVSGARSEDQRPRPASGHSGPHSGGLRTGATTASEAAARARQDEDARDKDLREFDHYVKMQLQQQPTQQRLTRLQQLPSRSTEQRLTRLQQPPSRSSAEGGGGEVAPGPASPDLELDLELRL